MRKLGRSDKGVSSGAMGRDQSSLPRSEFLVERQERQEFDFESLPIASRGLGGIGDVLAGLPSFPNQAGMGLGRAILEQHLIGVVGLSQRIESRPHLAREFRAADDEPDFGVQVLRSFVEVHRTDEDGLAIENEELGMQRISTAARYRLALPAAPCAAEPRAYLVQIRTFLEQLPPVM